MILPFEGSAHRREEEGLELRPPVLVGPQDPDQITSRARELDHGVLHPLEVGDTAVLDDLTKQVVNNDYRFSALVLAIAESIPFQHKTNQVPLNERKPWPP